MNRQPTKPCKWCGEENPTHYPFQCKDNPKRNKYKLPKQGKVAFAMKMTRDVWFDKNPPDSNGFYHCYLNISNQCPNRLLPIDTMLDHVQPRSSHPELRFDLLNLMPCCFWCNSLKGSRSLKEALKLGDKIRPER